ncbi:class II aldolase/adducin family protein [Agrobacterium larrymoorei]|uniref:Ribulose-5-phosphate 4-epimerase/fuculose-1-phosphate aldolase n=1 Tax=Agrobacterium larrymoorei TaxID=160699 RepID=A0AAJ2EQR9_9HYPH|nr:class II aldolase/adducin family protein [Agrobacterium larrymoorei]MDQ1183719.1 ribulose-5-phosphate 4-epimerase/fuculose-1-phosphate aldolase [Agrobacterium larrymoorei]MDR6100944.1 ribulose-5-phosphate 4-epimerase/fuculose-1-phosphate aldolase [Agrobacterium larrymoorei]
MNAPFPELLNGKTEAELRVQLADFYHLVSYLGWTELIFNHISVRIPGPDHVYLVNPFGLHYDEVTPDNLVKVGVDGKLVEDNGYKANPAGFALHGVIHQHRPDVGCVAHTHTTPISAITLKESGFEHDSFYGAQLYGRVAYHAFEGITLYDDERERMLASLGDKNVLVLRNHGIAVAEADIPTTFMLLWTVQRAAEIQCAANALPGANTSLPPAIMEKCATDAQRLIEKASFAQLLFDAMVRKMKRDRPAH